ncbi:MAG: metal-dependent transcriptional regulator [Elusimicrobiota bacterium]|jgi:DtxR family Mn-dependent transcriptional regulator|nr:metal-dependent transcriptional regulator [Elusimicrobiota bacterium]
MKQTKNITGSMEDYLEAIAIASVREGAARVTDIKTLLSVKTPSVSGALGVLSKAGLIKHEKYGRVTLTKKGAVIAKKVKKKHAVISAFLHCVLGVSPDAADIDACKIEHVISEQTFKKLCAFMRAHKK